MKLIKYTNNICKSCNKPISFTDIKNQLFNQIKDNGCIHLNCEDAINDEYYSYVLTNDDETNIIASTDKNEKTNKLSLINCKEIEYNFKLTNLAENYAQIFHYPDSISKGLIDKETGEYYDEVEQTIKIYKDAFIKASELLINKNYNLEDLELFFEHGVTYAHKPYPQNIEYKKKKFDPLTILDKVIWPVKFVMACGLPGGCTEPDKECTCDIVPAIDENGCYRLYHYNDER